MSLKLLPVQPLLPRYSSIHLSLASFLLALGCTSCSSRMPMMEQMTENYAQGHYKEAERMANEETLQSGARTNFQSEKSSSWYLLCSALCSQAAGDFPQAIDYYDHCLNSIDFYRQESALENLETLLLDDRRAAYDPPIFEQLLTRFYFALALKQAGKSQECAALLRQHEETLGVMQESLKGFSFLNHIEVQPDPLAKYLLACCLEESADLSNARILFKQVEQLTHEPFVEKDLKVLGKRKEKAWLVLIVHKGLVPEKINSYSIGAAASQAALEYYMKTRDIDPAWTTLTGLAIPEYRDRPSGQGPKLSIEIAAIASHITLEPLPLSPSGPSRQNYPQLPATFVQSASPAAQKIEAKPFFNITKAARSELNQKLPATAARALARQLLRQALFTQITPKGEGAGFSRDLLLLIANANTQADTRSWSLLPSTLECARIDLEPGSYQFSFQCQSPELPNQPSSKRPARSDQQTYKQTHRLELKAGLNLVELYAPSACWLVSHTHKQEKADLTAEPIEEQNPKTPLESMPESTQQIDQEIDEMISTSEKTKGFVWPESFSSLAQERVLEDRIKPLNTLKIPL